MSLMMIVEVHGGIAAEPDMCQKSVSIENIFGAVDISNPDFAAEIAGHFSPNMCACPLRDVAQGPGATEEFVREISAANRQRADVSAARAGYRENFIDA
jgi:hypothetical protein